MGELAIRRILNSPLCIFFHYPHFRHSAVTGDLSNKFNRISRISRRYKDTPPAELLFN
jgi:hypothetical protein